MKKRSPHLIVAINNGSSSIKFSLFDTRKNPLSLIVSGHLKGLHTKNPSCSIKTSKGNLIETTECFTTSKEAIHYFFNTCASHNLLSEDDILAICHRVVHGGKKHTKSCIVTPAVLDDLKACNDLAPLHNAYSLEGIEAVDSFFSKKMVQVAVFDTAFHQSMPDVASHYAIPVALAEKYGIYRYGFHGISHEYLWESYSSFTKKNKANIITCHLGNGSSLCAIRDGKSLDTSMGFTPCEGLVMATRSGDIDAQAALYLCQKETKTPQEMMDFLNEHSGLLGVSQVSGNMKELIGLYDKDPLCRLSVDLFCYRIAKYIGAYTATLGSLDAIIFSAGIGENAPFIRQKIADMLTFLGVLLDSTKNEQVEHTERGDIFMISSENSRLPVFVIATDENSLIAKKTFQLLADNA